MKLTARHLKVLNRLMYEKTLSYFNCSDEEFVALQDLKQKGLADGTSIIFFSSEKANNLYGEESDCG